MMKKSEKWKANRVQIKREKRRMWKKTKPEYEGHSGRRMVTDKPGFDILAGFSSAIPEREVKINRRKRNVNQGNR